MMVMVKCTMTTITHQKEDIRNHLMLQPNQYTSPLAEDRQWNQVIDPSNYLSNNNKIYNSIITTFWYVSDYMLTIEYFCRHIVFKNML